MSSVVALGLRDAVSSAVKGASRGQKSLPKALQWVSRFGSWAMALAGAMVPSIDWFVPRKHEFSFVPTPTPPVLAFKDGSYVPRQPERTVEDLACFVKRYALEKNQGGFFLQKPPTPEWQSYVDWVEAMTPDERQSLCARDFGRLVDHLKGGRAPRDVLSYEVFRYGLHLHPVVKPVKEEAPAYAPEPEYTPAMPGFRMA